MTPGEELRAAALARLSPLQREGWRLRDAQFWEDLARLHATPSWIVRVSERAALCGRMEILACAQLLATRAGDKDAAAEATKQLDRALLEFTDILTDPRLLTY